MKPTSSKLEERQCDTVKAWLASRPLRDNPQMAGAGSSLPWDEWVEQGRNAADTEACLLAFLENEQDPVTRSDVALALGYVGGERSVERLIGLLKDKEPMVVMEAAAALGRIGNQAAVPPLIEALQSDYANVRANACQALGTLGGDQATTALTAVLRDHDPFVRSAAQEALARSHR
ncbi:MAG: HEAT repeat domain-containing protein [Caldilineaceae bacterium]